eukprot:jgi/Psemu1/192313/e_gw1.125.75.1
MAPNTSNEFDRLVQSKYDNIFDVSSVYNHNDDNFSRDNKQEKGIRWYNKWKSTAFRRVVAIVLFLLLLAAAAVGTALFVGFGFGSGDAGFSVKSKATTNRSRSRNCAFCDQSPPTLHEDKSYSISIPSIDSDSDNHNPGDNVGGEEVLATATVTVTPMTITYDYELYDGQILYTNPSEELIPNLDFDYAVLEVSAVRNLHRDTGTPVSLDEVYLHHVNILPINMIGAEVLSRGFGNDNDDDNNNNNNNHDDPYIRYLEGHAFHVRAEETPHIRMNAHLLSNKNLAPIDGSIERARKECNECYYAPGKGSDCTPEVSGTFLCCGDSVACLAGGEDCACATTMTTTTHAEKESTTTTRYRIEFDLLISRDIDRFRGIDQWNFAAPACVVNLNGDAIFDAYPPDNFCAKNNMPDSVSVRLVFGGGSLFHNIPEQPQPPNNNNSNNTYNPYVKTSISIVAPTGGTIVFAQSHMHTGGVNATLRINGAVLCATTAQHGTNPDPATNARNEQNHLVRLSSCYDQIESSSSGNRNRNRGVRFEAGDVFTTESVYYAGNDDPRLVGTMAAGEHKNVMSMFFVAVVFDGDSEEFLARTQNRTSSNLSNNFVPIVGLSRSQRDGLALGPKTKEKTGHLR